MFHHLDTAGRAATLREIARVLVPGGTLTVLDFGPPRSALDRALLGLLHRGDAMNDNLEGRIPAMMNDAGFADAREAQSLRSLFGALAIWEARRPASRAVARSRTSLLADRDPGHRWLDGTANGYTTPAMASSATKSDPEHGVARSPR